MEKKVCKVCGGKHHGRGYCRKHYYEAIRDGTIEKREGTKRKGVNFKEHNNHRELKSNDVVYYDDYAELILTDRRGNEVGRTKIDIEDVKLFADKRVCKDSKDYAICRWEGKQRKVHRIVMGVVDNISIEVDHINGDPSDNRKCNLRICTHSENLKNQKKHRDNTSGCTGVTWHKRDKVWRVQITVDGNRIEIGRFKNKEEAIEARKEAEKKYYGEYARGDN